MSKVGMNFRTKLFITYLLLISIPLFILGYFTYRNYMASIENNVKEYVPAILKQANTNIDNYMSGLLDVPLVMTRSDDIMAILRKNQAEPVSAREQDAFFVQTFMKNNVLQDRKDVIAIFVEAGDRIYSSSRQPYEGRAFSQESNPFRQHMDLKNKVLFLPPDRQSLVFENNPAYISVYKQLYDSDNMKILATVLLIVDLSGIKAICENIPLSKNGVMFIVNDLNQTVYHNRDENIGETLASEIKLGSTFFELGIHKDRYITSAEISNFTKWTLAVTYPIKELAKETVSIRNFTFALFSVCFIAAIILSAIFSQTVTRPIRSLQKLMKKVEKGNFEVSYPVVQQDELGQLGNSFNRMVRKIQELVQQVYQVQIRQREAELAALQNQISPHFLYNTLESIQMVIEIGDDEKAFEMINALSSMLRFAARRGDIVTVGDEVKHVSDYLYIQQMRYGSRCEYAIELDPGIQGYYVPKFILQPLVENSIRHVVEKTNSFTSINIEIRQTAGGIKFTVSDTGPGIPQEALQDMEKKFSDAQLGEHKGGIGLMNVHSRIRLMYGHDYGVTIESSRETGTSVVVFIPLLTEP
ncbi:MAG: sensor histidine kinase [Bacillota bacterium]